MNAFRPANYLPDKPEKGRPLGEALHGFLRSSGLDTMIKHPEMHEVWQRTVGPDIAGHTRLSRFQGGVLEIAVDSSALLADIEFHRAALLTDLRREIRKPFVASIRFVLKPMQDDHDGHEPDRR